MKKTCIFLIVIIAINYLGLSFSETSVSNSNWYKSSRWTQNAYAYNDGVLYIINGNGNTFEEVPTKYTLYAIDMSTLIVCDTVDLGDCSFICAFPYNNGVLLLQQKTIKTIPEEVVLTTLSSYTFSTKELISIISNTEVYNNELVIRDALLDESTLYLLYDAMIISIDLKNYESNCIYRTDSRIINRIEFNHCSIYDKCLYIQESDLPIYKLRGFGNQLIKSIDTKTGREKPAIPKSFAYWGGGTYSYVVVENSIIYSNSNDYGMHSYNILTTEDKKLADFVFCVKQVTDDGLFCTIPDFEVTGKQRSYLLQYDSLISDNAVFTDMFLINEQGYKDVLWIPDFGFIGLLTNNGIKIEQIE